MLSETLLYLYLVFDEDNVLHHRPYVFSTEGHPFPVSQRFILRDLWNSTSMEEMWEYCGSLSVRDFQSPQLTAEEMMSVEGVRLGTGVRC